MADNESPPTNWLDLIQMPSLPSEVDKLFISSEADWWNNACLNFFPDGWGLYSMGYKDAGDLLVKEVEVNRAHQDSLVYPILFLYRQYLELSIKDIIRKGRKLQYETESIPKDHRLDGLWKICSQLLAEIAPGDSEDAIKEIGRLLTEFCTIDPKSEAFRYPEKQDGSPAMPEIRHINLRNVREIIGKIAVILDGANGMLDHYSSLI